MRFDCKYCGVELDELTLNHCGACRDDMELIERHQEVLF